jgi:lysophospholipase L1-like esterase
MDVPIRYDLPAYSAWKQTVSETLRNGGATIVNLENLVPAENWGRGHEGDLDYIHFTNAGHQAVARALQPYIARETSHFPRGESQ